MTLDDALRKSWKRVRKAFFFPNIPDPKFVDNAQFPAFIEPKKQQISVNRSFAKRLLDTGLISEETLFDGLLAHETAHHTKLPYDFKTWLKLYAAVRDVADTKTLAMYGLNDYMDTVINTHITVEKRMDDVADLYKVLFSDELLEDPVIGPGMTLSKRFNDVRGSLYERLWGYDMDTTVPPEDEHFVDTLSQIDYMHSLDRQEDAKTYVATMKPLLEEILEAMKDQQKKQKKGKKKKGQQGQQGEQGQSSPADPNDEYESQPQQGGGEGEQDEPQQQMPMDDQDGQGDPFDDPFDDPDDGEGDGAFDDGQLDQVTPDNFSDNEIRDGLREYAEETKDPQKLADLIQELELDKRLNPSEENMPGGRGGKIDEKMATVMAYTQLAKSYDIPIKQRDMHKDGSLYPDTLTKYQMGDDIKKLDPFNSYGKIIPGLSQKWNYKESETVGEKEGIPDAIIMLDSSGSMVDPLSGISYAVLGAICAANAYLENDAEVAVLNFSNKTLVTDYTKSERDVHTALCSYLGSGTVLDTKKLDDLVEKASDKVDIILISDLVISNISQVIQNLGDHKKTNHITFIHAAHSGGIYAQEGYQRKQNIKQLKKEFEGSENVSYYVVSHDEDIPKIVLGETTKNFE